MMNSNINDCKNHISHQKSYQLNIGIIFSYVKPNALIIIINLQMDWSSIVQEHLTIFGAFKCQKSELKHAITIL